MTLLEADNLYKDFGEGDNKETIIKGISLKVEEGDFLSILGPSGSGKSTLLYLLSTLENPTKGEVYYKRSSYSGMKKKEKSIMRNEEFGFVFQSFNLINNLTLEDNVLLPITLGTKKQKVQKDKLHEILDFVGLYEKRKKYPTEISGGMKQRIAIARAIITEPKIIFADEPIGSLDSKNSKNVMELFQKINKEKNTTIIQVTHNESSTSYGNRVVIVKDGILKQS